MCNEAKLRHADRKYRIGSVLHVGVQSSTLGSRGYFFLMDTDGSRRSRVNEAQSAEEKKIINFF